jgi:C4-dicarboxylate-binding protein DctP
MNITARRGVLAIALSFCAVGAAGAAEYTMRISHQYPPAHQVAKAIERFAADVRASTQGKVDVQVFGSEQLFKATQNHAAVARGQVEAAMILGFQWGNTIPEMNLPSIPFLMTHVDQLKKFPSSEAARILNAKLEAKGVKNLAWIVDANDGLLVSNKAPLNSPAAFKGVKIRGLSKLVDAGFVAVGASPSAMPGSEVYQALQTGVIDAALTGVGAAYSRRFYEVQKYGVASAFVTAYSNLLVNPAWWSRLPAPLRADIEAAAHKAEASLLPTSDEVAPEEVKRLRDKGMNVTILSKEQEKQFADAMQPAVIKAFVASAPDGAKLIEMVKKL